MNAVLALEPKAGWLISAASKALIWLFFLLIFDPVLVLMGSKFGLPIKPIGFYAVLAAGLFGVALAIERGVSPLKDARLFFLSFAALAALGLVMYRGEGVGPDFGGKLLRPLQMPSSIGYALWPVVNLVAGAGLYLLARREEHRRTIINAAFVALILQAAAMEADMWWPAIFSESIGRAGGFATNANDAALLVTVLAALLLPSKRFAAYAVMIAVAAVLFSQSRSGFLFTGLVVVGFFAARWMAPIRRPHVVFVIGYAAVILGTLFFSPVLNVTDEQIKARNIHAEPGKIWDPNVDAIVTMKERLQSRTSIDASAGLRRAAISFYSDIVKQYPFGLGTGFTNKFRTGPHNMWLKLSADVGILAALLFTVMLTSALWCAIKTRSSALFCLASIAWATAFLDHAAIVSPILLTSLAMGLGMAARSTGDYFEREPSFG